MVNGLFSELTITFKVHPKINICWKYTPLHAMQDVDELISLEMDYWQWLGALWIVVMFLSAVWTLILTAPIHCRGSFGEQVI